jgi:hypothetical protein
MKIIEVLYNTRFHPEYGFQSQGFRIGWDYESPIPGGITRKCIKIEHVNKGRVKEKPHIDVHFSDDTCDIIYEFEKLTSAEEYVYNRILPPAEYQSGEENNEQPQPSIGEDVVQE